MTETKLKGYEELRADLREIEMEVLTEGLTLPMLIREGAKYTDQKIGGFVDVDKNQTCALSAAAMALEARTNG